MTAYLKMCLYLDTVTFTSHKGMSTHVRSHYRCPSQNQSRHGTAPRGSTIAQRWHPRLSPSTCRFGTHQKPNGRKTAIYICPGQQQTKAIEALFAAALMTYDSDDSLTEQLKLVMHSTIANNKHALASLVRFNWTRLSAQKEPHYLEKPMTLRALQSIESNRYPISHRPPRSF